MFTLTSASCYFHVTPAEAGVQGLDSCFRGNDESSNWPGRTAMAGLVFLLAWALGSSVAAAASLGTATFTAQSSCPAGSLVPAGLKTTCYKVTVNQCPGGEPFIAWLKVEEPTIAAKGTILFTTGIGGNLWYDQGFVFGSLVISSVVAAGYATAQISFEDYSSHPVSEPSGWLSVLDGSNQGTGNLACRYATLASGFKTSSIYPGGNLAATGNSAGGALIAYALAWYGLGTGPVFTLAEVTSGPPYARVDYGCLCNQAPTLTPFGQGFMSQCYYGVSKLAVDPAYAATAHACSSANASHVEPPGIDFLADSVVNGSEVTSYPETTLNVIFGGQDGAAGVPNGLNWANAGLISAQKLNITYVADAPHELLDNFPAALEVINDLTSF